MENNTSLSCDNKYRQITGIIIGCGNRGQIYAQYAQHFPERFRLIAIADSRSFIRQKLQKIYSLDDKCIFNDWRQLVNTNVERLADCAIITLPDREHYEATIQLAAKGYHILLEKPMATKIEHCKEIVQVCEDNKVLLAVCHVLRYLPVVKKIKQLIDENLIGKLISIQHMEAIGFWHFAHSYVRGNWHNENESCFSLLAKCCHDIDLIQYWMEPRQCTQISSFGKLMHFTRENKPNGASQRCLNCSIESTCPYSAKKIYLDTTKQLGLVAVVAPDIEEQDNCDVIKTKVQHALNTGPYGKCVYGECNNDVVDQQVTILNFDDGATATMQMIAFTEHSSRRTSRFFGTHGELTWNGEDTIEYFDFLTQKRTVYDETDKSNVGIMGGHGGADFFAMDSFIRALSFDQPELIGTGAHDSLKSHILTFAAEKARKENRVCQISEFL
ncbi:unnamed protein product [Adineta steineri]|uniref:Uncharacterized protein n=1 Tax=Adineta steineri TaxID=433720 RepID=A0A818G8V6_9BILA|nr:unnamed protein product [Adineta steineri]CAF3486234.1 unnamed protein product [Adineta steineri]